MKILLTITAAIIALSGCTKTLVAEYNPNIKLNNANAIEKQKIAVFKFEDTRAWIDKKDEKSPSFIAKQGPWKFGLEYEGQAYEPVTAVLQDIFVKEFKTVGVDAFKADSDVAGAYKLEGKILNFEFENEAGLVTVTSRRHVSLALTLTDSNNVPVFSNELFNEIDRENEGMGVMHSTNVEKLMQGVLKTVMVSVVNRFNDKVSENVTVSVSINGTNINLETQNYSHLTAGL